MDIEAIRAENDRFDKEVEFMAQAEREVRQQQRMAEEEAEWMEGVRKREMEQEEQALEQHRAREAQAYDDWAMWDELRRGPGMQARPSHRDGARKCGPTGSGDQRPPAE